jgi:hypothetical protein
MSRDVRSRVTGSGSCPVLARIRPAAAGLSSDPPHGRRHAGVRGRFPSHFAPPTAVSRQQASRPRVRRCARPASVQDRSTSWSRPVGAWWHRPRVDESGSSSVRPGPFPSYDDPRKEGPPSPEVHTVQQGATALPVASAAKSRHVPSGHNSRGAGIVPRRTLTVSRTRAQRRHSVPAAQAAPLRGHLEHQSRPGHLPAERLRRCTVMRGGGLCRGGHCRRPVAVLRGPVAFVRE